MDTENVDPVEQLRQTARNLLNAIDSEEAASWALGSDVTDEFRAALDAFEQHRQLDDQRRLFQAELDAHRRRVESASGLRRAVLELHGPHQPGRSWATCGGCDLASCGGEHPDWPCRTYVLARDWPADPVQPVEARGPEYGERDGDLIF